MSKIKLDLLGEGLFIDNELCLDNKVSVIFGKNGTGKSTLTKLFRNQITSYDIRIFQGFEGVVGDNKKLNAVVLGEENNETEKEIEINKNMISNKEIEIKHIEENILENSQNDDNIWSRHRKKKSEYNIQRNSLEEFYISSARVIKNTSSPQISETSYNKANFEREISEAALLLPYEIDVLKKTINISVREAKKIIEPVIDLRDILYSANELLNKKVSRYIVIEEFKGNKGKEAFAELGMQLHKAGDKCAFCGNDFTAERETLIQTFFSANEIELFKCDLKKFTEKLDRMKNDVESLLIDKNMFYPEYEKNILDINIEFSKQKNSLIEFLLRVRKEIVDKSKSLSESISAFEIEIPVGLSKCIKEYNELVEENNSSNLVAQQSVAKRKLRLHEVKKLVEEFRYDVEKTKLDALKDEFSIIDSDYSQEKKKIQMLKTEIAIVEKEITRLRALTKNEEKLADEINKKLKFYVSFQLIYVKNEENNGFYRIRCNRSLEERDIDKLSTGEKNIIAFLYFMEKLFEVTEGIKLPKLIVFDDPMNSNDDTMQYVIIEELQKLFHVVKNNDKLVIFTHNCHFYLNVKYKLGGYKENTFIHLRSYGKNIKINRLANEKDDFKTNYEALWKELKFLNEHPDANESMLLNPIRRIIETYSKFNAINKIDMLSKVVGAKKLFNVNSHSIDDLEAELNGKDKQIIINMLKECFSGIEAERHFNQHWES